MQHNTNSTTSGVTKGPNSFDETPANPQLRHRNPQYDPEMPHNNDGEDKQELQQQQQHQEPEDTVHIVQIEIPPPQHEDALRQQSLQQQQVQQCPFSGGVRNERTVAGEAIMLTHETVQQHVRAAELAAGLKTQVALEVAQARVDAAEALASAHQIAAESRAQEEIAIANANAVERIAAAKAEAAGVVNQLLQDKLPQVQGHKQGQQFHSSGSGSTQGLTKKEEEENNQSSKSARLNQSGTAAPLPSV